MEFSILPCPLPFWIQEWPFENSNSWAPILILVILATQQSELRKTEVQSIASPTQKKRAVKVSQVVGCLPSKHEYYQNKKTKIRARTLLYWEKVLQEAVCIQYMVDCLP
jgi:hypothetical protein